jgi:uncharacterized protein with PQ loop repeat
VHGAEVAQVFGCAGAVLAVGLNAPQAWTSCVDRKVAGLSPAARWLAVAQSATWLAYGLVEHVRLQLLTNAVCLSLQLSVLAALLLLDPAARARRLAGPQAATTGAWLLVVAACGLTGALPVATLAAVVGGVSVVPQLWHLARSRGGDRSGVSVATTVLSLVASLCWTAHGLALALPAVALPSLAGAVAAAWTLALLRPPAWVRRPVPALGRQQPLAA